MTLPLYADLVRERAQLSGDRSQFGEGSIISDTLDRLGVTEGTVVEFGAGDGLELSNTAHLWQAGWPAVLIEADADRFAQLRANIDSTVADELAVIALHDTVVDVDDYVDDDPAVVSCDIDGDDYAVVNRMLARPTVLVVEHHPMVPWHVHFVGGPDVGCSARALVTLLESKGYCVVAMTHCNTVAIPGRYRQLFDDVELDPSLMFDPSAVTFAVSNVRTGDYRMHGPWPFGRGVELEPVTVDYVVDDEADG